MLLADERLDVLWVQDVAAALAVLLGEAPPTDEDARRILAALVASRRPIDEHALEAIELALRASPRPWDVVGEVRARLPSKGCPYAAALVGVAGLRRLAAEHEGPQESERLLTEALDEARGLRKAPERMRVLVRLASLIPRLASRERALGLLGEVRERASLERDDNVRGELRIAVAGAAARLDDGPGALDLVEGIANQALAAPASSERWFRFETLDACAVAMTALGDRPRGLALVQRIAEAARVALRAPEVGRFFQARTLFTCGQALQALVDPGAADFAWASVLGSLGEFEDHDLTDLLDLGAETAGRLPGDGRYRLAGQVLTAAGSTLSPWPDLYARLAVDLVVRLAGGP